MCTGVSVSVEIALAVAGHAGEARTSVAIHQDDNSRMNEDTGRGSGSAEDSLPKLRLTHASGASVEIYLQGAHVTSWRPAGGEEVLFMSRESRFETGVPIRGGIPIVFPQFSNRGPLPQHGFARTQSWEVEEQGMNAEGASFARFRLTDSAPTRALWPHSFLVELLVTLDEGLSTTLRVTNTEERSFNFTSALHTYFQVGDVGGVRVEGLEGSRFLGTESGGESQAVVEPIRIEGETDGVYGGTADRLWIRDASRKRTIVIDKPGFPDAVVWNPWVEKAQAMPDFGDDEYRTMLCVEPGAIAEPVHLAPGEQWSGTQVLRVEPSPG